MKKYNTIIIGFGKAGKTLAFELARKGEKILLIEKDSSMYGGTCINVGCIPSKRLITDSLHATKGNFDIKKEYYRNAILEKRKLVEALREANYKKLVSAGVEVINGSAKFINNNTIEVNDISGDRLQFIGEKIVINTGASPIIPDIEGIANNSKVFISETIMELEELPKQLTVIGGGYIGLEFACMYANFGSKVTIIQDGDTFIPKEDEDIADAVKSVLEEKGIEIITSAKMFKINEGNILYALNSEEKSLEGDAVLIATGRKANVESLNLDSAGIVLNKRGGIQTDEFLRTSAKNVWAAGDVCGNLQFTYISLDDSRIILEDMANTNNRTVNNRGVLAYSVFIDPPLSRVGMSEKEARDKNYDYRVVSMKTEAIPKAKVLRKTKGMLKAIIDNNTGYILGATLFCEESHEIINMIKLAIDYNLDYTVLRDFIYTHPTIAEGLNDLFALK